MKALSRVALGMFMLTGAAAGLLAQAPTSAQVWDVRFIVDGDGPHSPRGGETIGITCYARVGILPNTTAGGTANFGVTRVGGAGSATSGFRITLSDPVSAALGLGQGSLEAGSTADVDQRDLIDTNGAVLVGTFAPFRSTFSPQVAPAFLGSNTEPANGLYGLVASGAPAAFNFVGSRAFNFGSEGSGPQGAATANGSDPANLVGPMTPVFRIYYRPSLGGPRTISVTVSGMSA